MACVKKTQYGYRVDWRDKQGNRYRKTFELKKDAEDFLSTVKVDMKNGTFITAKTAPFFREVAEQWFQNQRDLRPSTLEQYRTHLDKYLLPALGDQRFSEIDIKAVEARAQSLVGAEEHALQCRTPRAAERQQAADDAFDGLRICPQAHGDDRQRGEGCGSAQVRQWRDHRRDEERAPR